MKFTALILQNSSSFETRTARIGAMLQEHAVTVRICDVADLAANEEIRALLRNAAALPVGSVEFVSEAMRVCGIGEPENMTYPEALKPFLHRDVYQLKAGRVLGTWFVKPCQTKAFTGFVFDTVRSPANLTLDQQADYEAFMEMPETELVWVAEPVSFRSEWRYYVQDGEVIGSARYDPDGIDSAPKPDMRTVLAAVATLNCAHPFAIDFGVLSTEQTALVEVNDAWAIGLYSNALLPQHYLEFLASRWASLLAQQTSLQANGADLQTEGADSPEQAA